MRVNPTSTNDFYKWLQNRNKTDQARPQKRAQLGIPKPPLYRNPEEPRTERGVTIIDFS